MPYELRNDLVSCVENQWCIGGCERAKLQRGFFRVFTEALELWRAGPAYGITCVSGESRNLKKMNEQRDRMGLFTNTGKWAAKPGRRLCGCSAGLLLCLVAVAVVSAVVFTANAVAQSRVRPGGTEAPQAAKEKKRVVLRFLTDSDFPPFNFYDEDGVLTGFNVDLARAICVELNTACDINVGDWSRMFDDLIHGKADAAIASHSVTGQALLKVDFSDRYFHTPGRFAALRDGGINGASVEELEGKRIGVATGTTHEAFVRQYFLGSRINVFENADKAREALVERKVDAVFDDAISLAFWLNGTLSKQCCKFAGGAFLEPKFFGDGMAIAVSRREPVLKQEINEALYRIRESGRLEELTQRYFPFRLY